MAIYAVGDVHACLDSLKELLQTIDFHPGRDRLLFVGDLINRGPDSLDVLRYVMDLGDSATTIMGNHEAWAVGGLAGKAIPFFQVYARELEKSSEVDLFYEWMRCLPFMHHEEDLGITMVHAGLHPHWSLDEALRRARDLETVFRDDAQLTALLEQMDDVMVESDPGEGSQSICRRRWFDMALFTRIRLCSAQGELLWPRNARAEGLSPFLPPSSSESRFQPWYAVRRAQPGEMILFGHWAAAGIVRREHALGLDSGCVYGRRLTAVRLDDPTLPLIQVACSQHVKPE